MDSHQRNLLALVQSALTGLPAKMPEDFSLKSLGKDIAKHHLSVLAYNGAFLSGLDVRSEDMQDLFISVCRAFSVHENQMAELNRIYAAFDAAGIDYLPMKGAVIKAIYPSPEMRFMSDADILIRTEQYENIRPVLLELGFTEKLESDHELTWTHPVLYLELHKRLIPSYNADYYAYFGDGWRMAKPTSASAHRYELSCEDQLIFLFTHFAKHYRDGGIGIKHMVDLWLYHRRYTLDAAYVKAKLKQLQLYDFYKNIRQVLEVWFAGKPPTELTDHITDVIFRSGAYGTFEGHTLSRGLREAKAAGSAKQVRRNSVLRAVFLPYSHMCDRYPVLKRLPFLLPAMWVARWFTAVFFRKSNIRRQRENIRLLSKQRIEDYQQALHYVGLDFNFSMSNEANDVTVNQAALLQCITAAIRQEPAGTLPEGIDWKELIAESAKQAVSILAFDGACRYGNVLPEEAYNQWFALSTKSMMNGVRVMRAQQNLVQLMEGNGLSYFILKGAASAAYYPKPDARSFGDVDFLIDPAQRQTVEEKLVQAGYERWKQEHDCHVVYYKKGEHLEMHFEIAGIPYGRCGAKIRAFMAGAVQHYQECTFEGSTFRIPQPLYHGLILLLHMQHHMLGEGIGLRHLCDWGCFIAKTCTQPFWQETLLPFLQEIGLYTYARVMTRTCALYLHTPCPDWAGDVSPQLCNAVIQDIFTGGNFGRKDSRRSQSTVLVSQHGKTGTQHGALYNLICKMHSIVMSQYPILKKVPVLYPFFYFYRSVRFLWNQITGRRDPVLKLVPDARERRALYAQLHIFEIK